MNEPMFSNDYDEKINRGSERWKSKRNREKSVKTGMKSGQCVFKANQIEILIKIMREGRENMEGAVITPPTFLVEKR